MADPSACCRRILQGINVVSNAPTLQQILASKVQPSPPNANCRFPVSLSAPQRKCVAFEGGIPDAQQGSEGNHRHMRLGQKMTAVCCMAHHSLNRNSLQRKLLQRLQLLSAHCYCRACSQSHSMRNCTPAVRSSVRSLSARCSCEGCWLFSCTWSCNQCQASNICDLHDVPHGFRLAATDCCS